MRYLTAVLMLCVLALLLGAAGCAKKAQQSNVTQPQGMKYVSGTCAVCGKTSDKMIDFTVPHGPTVKVCSQECVAKIVADPQKYGGSLSGAAPGSVSTPAPPPVVPAPK